MDLKNKSTEKFKTKYFCHKCKDMGNNSPEDANSTFKKTI